MATEETIEEHHFYERPFISIKFQEGPAQEVGTNGCHLAEVIDIVLHALQQSNKLQPCRENAIAITKIQEAQHWLEHRAKLRAAQGVQGHPKPHVS